MVSTKTLYWAAAIGVAVVAVGSPILLRKFPGVWPTSQNAPSAVAATGAAFSTASPLATVAQPSPPKVQPPAAQPAQGSAEAAATVARATPSPPPAAAPAPVEPVLERPAFDVVRVEPTGETVVAGHAAPKAAVELRDEGRVIAQVSADELGQFVILPPPLSEGGHRLELAARSGGAAAVVSDAVTVDVAPQKAGSPRHAAPPTATASAPSAPKPVASAAPTQPPTASAPAAPKLAASAPPPPPKPAAATPTPEAVAVRAPPVPVAALVAPVAGAPAADGSVRVSVRTVEATEAGRLEVKGSAEANAIVRLYLNDSFLADASAGGDRQWSLTIEHGMSPGLYAIRADEVSRADGSVLARAEVSFAYPQHPSAARAPLTPAAAAAVAPPSPEASPLAAPSQAKAVAAAEAPKPMLTPQAPVQPVAPPAAPAPQAPVQPAATQAAPAPQAPVQPAAPPAAPTPPAATQAASAATSAPNPAAPTNVVVAEVRTTTVVRGDNLWDLARRYYSDGMRYRQIYEANASQIRNPRLIYIGQIFVVPTEPPP